MIQLYNKTRVKIPSDEGRDGSADESKSEDSTKVFEKVFLKNENHFDVNNTFLLRHACRRVQRVD